MESATALLCGCCSSKVVERTGKWKTEKISLLRVAATVDWIEMQLKIGAKGAAAAGISLVEKKGGEYA